MASRNSRLEDDLSCPICAQIFRQPVVLLCRHRFCKLCLEGFWDGSKDNCSCPLCCLPSSMDQLVVNTMLERTCEAYILERKKSDPMACQEHGSTLTLFCLEELLPACEVCKSSPRHIGHRLYSLGEAAYDCKVSRHNNVQFLNRPSTEMWSGGVASSLEIQHITQLGQGFKTYLWLTYFACSLDICTSAPSITCQATWTSLNYCN